MAPHFAHPAPVEFDDDEISPWESDWIDIGGEG
jgi:hypothetical protein